MYERKEGFDAGEEVSEWKVVREMTPDVHYGRRVMLRHPCGVERSAFVSKLRQKWVPRCKICRPTK